MLPFLIVCITIWNKIKHFNISVCKLPIKWISFYKKKKLKLRVHYLHNWFTMSLGFSDWLREQSAHGSCNIFINIICQRQSNYCWIFPMTKSREYWTTFHELKANSCFSNIFQFIIGTILNQKGMGITIITSAIVFNTLTPMGDQERISPNNIHVISSKQVMRIKRNIN